MSSSEDEIDDDYSGLDREELEDLLTETKQSLEQAAEMGQALMVELQQMELLKGENVRLKEQQEEFEAAQEEQQARGSI